MARWKARGSVYSTHL